MYCIPGLTITYNLLNLGRSWLCALLRGGNVENGVFKRNLFSSLVTNQEINMIAQLTENSALSAGCLFLKRHEIL